MGRQHPKTKTGRAVPQNKAATTKAASTSKPAPSIPALLTKVQELLTQCNYELALKFLQRILTQEPRNHEALGYLGIVQIETGELESAKEVSSIEIPMRRGAHYRCRHSFPCYRLMKTYQILHLLLRTFTLLNSKMKIPEWP